MTSRRPTARTGWWRLLLAALAAAVVTLLGTGTASAATLPNLETRVGVSNLATAYTIGVHESVSAGQRWGNGPPRAVSVVGRGVAANGVTKLGWSTGDDIYALTKAGNTPAWWPQDHANVDPFRFPGY